MNPYRASWNPLGTSNSEYGKFVYQNSFGPARSTSVGGMGQFGEWNQNQGQQHQHQPTCQNYTQQQQYGHHENYYDPHATCQNANANHTKGDGNDGGQHFTTQVGEEAAAAALGGKPDFRLQYASQEIPCSSETGAMKGLNLQGVQQYNHMKNAEPSRAEQCQPATIPCPSPDTSNATAEVCQGQGMDNASGGCDGDIQPDSEPQCPPKVEAEKPRAPLPTKWKGLPPNIQYGRQVRPRSSQMQMMTPQQQQSFKVMDNGCEDVQKGMKMPAPRVATAKAKISTQRTASQPAMKPQKMDNEPRLCGKCPKCKDYLPSSNGPNVMTFPTNSAAKMSVRTRQTYGQQGGRNFRAIQYHPRAN